MTDLDVEKIRRNHPVTEKLVYLNHASTGPLTSPAMDRMMSLIERIAREGFPPMEEVDAVMQEARSLAACLLKVNPGEIAFVKNTSEGILIALQSIPWNDGDNAIVMENAFPANVYPWRYLLPVVEKRWVRLEGKEDILREVESRIDGRTRAIALDWVHFVTGARLDLKTLGEFCRDRGIYLVVDAIQGLGAVPFDAQHCEFMSSHSAKWMLGPIGIGVLYVAERILDELVPTNIGWISAEWEGNFEDLYPLPPLKRDASRYEEGSPNLIGIYGMRENLKLLLDVGIDSIWARIRSLTTYLRSELRARKFEIFGPEDEERSSGIISFRSPTQDTHAIFDRLGKRKIACSFREGHIRISPHYYNTKEEIDELLSLL